MSGWFAVEKDTFDDPLWKREPMSEREAYLWLCRNAAWEDTKHRVGGEMIDCPKGSVFITLREFQHTTCWGSDTKVRNFLQRIEDAGLIERTVHGKRNAPKTRVSICEYAEKSEQAPEENAPETHRKRTKNAVKEQGKNKQTSEAKASSGECPSPQPANDQAIAVKRYNDAAEVTGWPKVQKLSPARARQLKARLGDCGGIEGWEVALRKAYTSDFCRGRTSKPFHGFSFDWLIKSANFTKLMEGNYDNRTGHNQQPSPAGHQHSARAGGPGAGTVDAFASVAAKMQRESAGG